MIVLGSGSIFGKYQGQDPCSDHCQYIRRSTVNQLRLPGTPVKALQLIRKNDTYYTISFRQCHFKGITLDA